MPWQETSCMDQRIQFIGDYLRGLRPVTELAARFGISRKTACEWIDCYADGGPSASPCASPAGPASASSCPA
jgi:hypothetical protein